ncbi:YlbF family regulator [Alteribacillus sp. JSM 102045]|uniref:YlbF family regulator n=1 Tax=Alteribacillus sp. JSM 102045 TaxID=1562101 RepID=UPI0035BEC32F
MTAVLSTAVDLLDESALVGQIVLQSEVFIHYKEARQRMASDKKAQHLIAEFADCKDKYDEVQRFGKYHPDYKTISKQVRQIKRELDLHEPIADFKKAEKELEKLLNEICAEIAGAVSPSIKVPTGNPYFDNASCGGGCGSGGSCGCS